MNPNPIGLLTSTTDAVDPVSLSALNSTCCWVWVGVNIRDRVRVSAFVGDRVKFIVARVWHGVAVGLGIGSGLGLGVDLGLGLGMDLASHLGLGLRSRIGLEVGLGIYIGFWSGIRVMVRVRATHGKN